MQGSHFDQYFVKLPTHFLYIFKWCEITQGIEHLKTKCDMMCQGEIAHSLGARELAHGKCQIRTALD